MAIGRRRSAAGEAVTARRDSSLFGWRRCGGGAIAVRLAAQGRRAYGRGVGQARKVPSISLLRVDGCAFGDRKKRGRRGGLAIRTAALSNGGIIIPHN